MAKARYKSKKNKKQKTDKSLARTIKVRYDTPFGLEKLSPLIKGQWSVPQARALKLAEAGRLVPGPVVGHMMIDTGATCTCMSVEAAKSLGLQPVSQMAGFGAGGKHKNEVFQVRMQVTVQHPKKGTTLVTAERRIQAIPDLEKALQMMDAKINNQPVRLIGLIGRDFLKHTRFYYDGHLGEFTLTILMETFKKPPQ